MLLPLPLLPLPLLPLLPLLLLLGLLLLLLLQPLPLLPLLLPLHTMAAVLMELTIHLIVVVEKWFRKPYGATLYQLVGGRALLALVRLAGGAGWRGGAAGWSPAAIPGTGSTAAAAAAGWTQLQAPTQGPLRSTSRGRDRRDPCYSQVKTQSIMTRRLADPK
jgi:hypothetical protein